MSTSGTYTFTRNRDQICIAALRVCGATEAGQPVPPDKMQETAEALNTMVKALRVELGGLWAIAEYTLPLDTVSSSYTIGPGKTLNVLKPLEILEARRRDLSGNDTPIFPLNRDEYMALPAKSEQGTVNQFYYQPLLAYGVLYVWNVSSVSTDSIVFSAKIPFQDFDSMPDNADFPTEALRMLKWNLAEEIAPEWDVNPQKYKMIQDKAMTTKNEFKFYDMEESFSFAPETRR